MTSPADLDAWNAVLDQYEQRLTAQEDIVRRAEDGVLPTPEDVNALGFAAAPVDVGPFPPELAGRAEALLARSHLVQDGLANLIETTRPARAARRLPAPKLHRASHGLDLWA